MTDNITQFRNPNSRLDGDANEILKNAGEAELEDVVVIGTKGDTIYFASNKARKADVLFLMEILKHELLSS
jgi:hypothetical protein